MSYRSRGFSGFSLMPIIVVAMIAIVGLGIVGGIAGNIYGFVNAKQVTGIVESVDNLTPQGVFRSGDGEIKYSFAVSIETDDGIIFNFSAEDRQWGAVKVGDKITAKAFPYAPWNFFKAGTYHGGRLIRKHKQ